MEAKQREFKAIEPVVWKAEQAGDSITGQLVRKIEREGELSARYFLLCDDGSNRFVWGSTVMDDRMALVPVGYFVRITFVEQTKNSKGQPLNVFKVEVAPE